MGRLLLGVVVWFGSYLLTALVITPVDAVAACGDGRGARRGGRPPGEAGRIPAILATGIGGILLGTVFGRIHSLDALFATTFGWTFLAAIVFGLVAFYPMKPPWLIRLRAERIGFFGPSPAWS